MAVIVAIPADHTREVFFLPKLKKALIGLPVGLSVALALFVASYWGLHAGIHGSQGTTATGVERITHTPDVNTHTTHRIASAFEPPYYLNTIVTRLWTRITSPGDGRDQVLARAASEQRCGCRRIGTRWALLS